MKRNMLIMYFLVTTCMIGAAEKIPSTTIPPFSSEGVLEYKDDSDACVSTCVRAALPAASSDVSMTYVPAEVAQPPIIIYLPSEVKMNYEQCFAIWCKATNMPKHNACAQAEFTRAWKSRSFEFLPDETISLETKDGGKKKKSWVQFLGMCIESEFIYDIMRQAYTCNQGRKIRGESPFPSYKEFAADRYARVGTVTLTSKGRSVQARLFAQHDRPEIMIAKFAEAYKLEPFAREKLREETLKLHAYMQKLK